MTEDRRTAHGRDTKKKPPREKAGAGAKPERAGGMQPEDAAARAEARNAKGGPAAAPAAGEWLQSFRRTVGAGLEAAGRCPPDIAKAAEKLAGALAMLADLALAESRRERPAGGSGSPWKRPPQPQPFMGVPNTGDLPANRGGTKPRGAQGGWLQQIMAEIEAMRKTIGNLEEKLRPRDGEPERGRNAGGARNGGRQGHEPGRSDG